MASMYDEKRVTIDKIREGYTCEECYKIVKKGGKAVVLINRVEYDDIISRHASMKIEGGNSDTTVSRDWEIYDNCSTVYCSDKCAKENQR